MASHIQNATIKNETNTPNISYGISYTASRNGSDVTYVFTIKCYLHGSETALLGTGKILKCTITVGGVSNSVTLKSTTDSWHKDSAEAELKATKMLSVTCQSTSGSENQTVTFVVDRTDGGGSAGEVSSSAYYVTSPVYYTACTAPSTFTASTAVFEDCIDLAWSGAKGGTSNAITGYSVQMAISTNGGSSWGGWASVWSNNQNEVTLYEDWIYERYGIEINRGYLVKFRIRTEGAAGSSYYSDWKTSNTVRKNSLPGKPTNPKLSATLISSGTAVTASWSASSDVDGNHDGYRFSKRINGGEIQSISMNSAVSRSVTLTGKPGDVIELLVRAEDKLSAVSDYLSLGSITINSAPTAPLAGEISKGSYSPGDSVSLSWSGATDADGNISGYVINYGVGDTEDAVEAWSRLAQVKTAADSGAYAFIPEQASYGQRIHFRIFTVDTLGAQSGGYYLGSILRNDVPHALIGAAGVSAQHVPHVSSGGQIQSHMPYIREGDSWVRHAGPR